MSKKLIMCSIIKRTLVKNLTSLARRGFYSGTNGNYDLAVVGGGIIGVASAREMLLRHPTMKVAVLEKESRLAAHQSGHNAGMVHAEYRPYPMQARLCLDGLQRMYKYCDSKGIPYKRCGKLIVATNRIEIERLKGLFEFYKELGVPEIELIGRDRILELEPFCGGAQAIWSPLSGIVDWRAVTQRFAEDFKELGGKIILNFQVTKFEETKDGGEERYPVTILSSSDEQKVRASNVLTCTGLHSDQIAELTGCARSPRIVPFRAEYRLLAPEKCHMVSRIIYPVPTPDFPSLGAHFTPCLDGNVLSGPHVVLAFRREGYKWSDIDPAELFDALRYPGFIKMTAKYFGFGIGELSKTVSIPLQMDALKKLIPCVNETDLSPGPSGVRAQALSLDGALLDEFVFDRGSGNEPTAKRVLHCRSTPAPGATGSLAIAELIVDEVEEEFQIQKRKNSEN